MAITTKKGDDGQSHFSTPKAAHLGGQVCLDKDCPLLEAIGSIDELQAILQLVGFDKRIIDDLNGIMGELVCGKKFLISNFKFPIKKMEEEIEKMEKKMPKINKFLKFKSKKSLELNWARTVCRRVERRVVALKKKQKIDKNILSYFNRLSDYLFLKSVKEN